MAGTSLLTLLDDIASLLDDIAVMTKIAAKKTAGVLGDDLALNAEQVSGVRADRELPVVWAVAKGSFKNKAILVPTALMVSGLASWALTPMLMLGGGYLCFEGFEKLVRKYTHDKEEEKQKRTAKMRALSDPTTDILALEKQKIKGAIRTDFILSAEIIVIALSTVSEQSLGIQFVVLSGIALLMTVGVYSLVAGIVKLDDAGLYLVKIKPSKKFWRRFSQSAGRGILILAPYLMKTISIVGTAAMFIVGGGILLHGLNWTSSMVEFATHMALKVMFVGKVLAGLAPAMINAFAGFVAGGLILLFVLLLKQASKKI